MNICFVGILWCIIGIQQGVVGQELGKSQSNSYFYLKQNGGYEYAFNTDTGLQSAQTADQSNEVTGHYMYYDKGIPYMVKYRAGIHGFQPEIIPAEQLMNGHFGPAKLQNFEAVDNSINSRDIRTSLPLQDNQNPNNYQQQQQQHQNHHVQSPTVSSYNIGQDTTLNFVQNALKTMQTQPMHISFNSGLGDIQHPSGPFTTTLRPPIATTLLQPVTRNEVQDINSLAAPPNPEPSHPYSFNYNADQSARSETADPSGNVIGSYSYYDEAGYHDISYKASDDTGFVVLGGNLAHNQPSPAQLQTEFPLQQQQLPPPPIYSPHPNNLPQQRRQLFRNNNFNFNNFRFMPDPRLTSHALDERNLGKRSLRSNNNALSESSSGKRSLRKFRRYAKW